MKKKNTMGITYNLNWLSFLTNMKINFLIKNIYTNIYKKMLNETMNARGLETEKKTMIFKIIII